MHRSIAAGVFLVLSWSMLVVPGSVAATLRVEQDGSGDFTVIQDAVDVAAVGDTILIGPGQYADHRPFTTDLWTEEAYVGVDVDSLTIRGTDRDGVIIGPPVAPDVWYVVRPKGIALSRERTTYLRVENLTVRNVHDGFHVFHTYDLTDVTVYGCSNGLVTGFSTGSRVVGSLFWQCDIGIGTFVGTRDFTVEDCEFVDTGSGVTFNETSNAVTRNSRFRNSGAQYAQGTTGRIVDCHFEGAWGYIDIVLSATLEILDCVVESDSRYSISISTYSHVTGTRNILRGGDQATLRFAGNSTADFHGNHILRSTGPSVMCEAYVTEPVEIDLTENYWGTSSPDSLRSWIVDGEDLHDPPFFNNFSKVLFDPFEGRPIPTRQESIGSLKGMYGGPR